MKEKQLTPLRSLLFVPGDRPERFDKALATSADGVIIDLEDACSPDKKDFARQAIADKLDGYQGKPIFVRINSFPSEAAEADMGAVVCDTLGAIMLPKAESVSQIELLDKRLKEIEKARGLALEQVRLLLLVETAKGIRDLDAMLSESPAEERILTVAFGAADYTQDLGIEPTPGGQELAYPRSKIAISCRAAGVQPPVDTPYVLDLSDVEALTKDALRARRLGFQGKLCIHPKQVDPCNNVFSPSEEEIDKARRIMQAYNGALAEGKGAIQLDGKFIDPPAIKFAERVMRISERLKD